MRLLLHIWSGCGGLLNEVSVADMKRSRRGDAPDRALSRCSSINAKPFGQEEGARLVLPRRVDQGATIDERPHAVGVTRLGCSEDRVVLPAVVWHAARGVPTSALRAETTALSRLKFDGGGASGGR